MRSKKMATKKRPIWDYLMVVLCLVAFVATIGLLSYFTDLGGWGSLRPLVLVVCIFAGCVYIRRWMRVICNDDWRLFAYAICGLGVFFSSLIVSDVTHELRHPMLEVASIDEAIQSGEEYFHVKNVEIDTLHPLHHGEFSTYRTHDRHYGFWEVDFCAFITYHIKGTTNGYWGYRLNSPRVSPFNEEKLRSFAASLDEKIQGHELPNGDGYYRRVMPRHEDYSNYMDACIFLNGVTGSPPVVFIKIEKSNKARIHTELVTLLAVMSSIMLIILLIFLFAKTGRSHTSINEEIEQERSEAINYLSNRENWYHISLIALLVGYYILMLIGGCNDFSGGINFTRTLQWGSLSKYLCIDRCEWWRLITSSLMHASFGHLICNLSALILFVSFNLRVSRSWLLWMVFFCTSIAADLVFMMLCPDDVLLGASGGIMGLYGIRVGRGIDMLLEDKNRSRKRKKAKTIGEMLVCLMGIEGIFVILPTIIISFMPGVSMIAHATGFLSGIVMWYVIRKVV